MRRNLYLVDGSAVLYRSHFAFSRNPLVTSTGLPTSAVFGLAGFLARLFRERKPDHLLLALDTPTPTFRHRLYPAYKANRQKMPEDLVQQLPLIDELLEALSVTVLRMPGFEADDLIASATRRFRKEGLEVFIVSGDKDLCQLVGEEVTVLAPGKDQFAQVLDAAAVEQKFGVPPDRLLDWLALVGDASDNVPGVPGIGPKKATALLSRFPSIEELYAHLEELSPADRQRLENHREGLALSQRLIALDEDVPLPCALADLAVRPPEVPRLRELYDRLEFRQLRAELGEETLPPRPAGNYHLIGDRAEAERIFALLRQSAVVAVDTETTSLNPLEAELLGVSFSVAEGEAFFLPWRTAGVWFGTEELRRHLSELFARPGTVFGGQNLKYDLHILRGAGVVPPAVGFDTLLAAGLLNPTLAQKNLDALALHYLGLRKIPTSRLLSGGRTSMAEVPLPELAEYACEDADVTLRLHRLFDVELERRGLSTLYREAELPLVPVLVAMEAEGVAIDSGRLAVLAEEFSRRLGTLETEVHALAGEEFNLNSPRQLSTILFDKLSIHKLLGKRVRKTSTGYSTDVQALAAFAEHPLVGAILDYRSLAKLKHGYVDTLPALVSSRTGRVHTSFNQAVTATGRLSSSDPNLQNIPIRTAEGRRIRDCFVPSRPGEVLLSADYSQIELRVLAHLSGDTRLIQTLRRGDDIHAATAAAIFGVPLAEVKAEQRGRAKTINFGIIYGMGPQRLAREQGISLDEAKSFIAQYFATYPGISAFFEAVLSIARSEQAVRTMLGRIRPLPEINAKNPQIRQNAERMAINTPIQGSAADLIKLAMIALHRRLTGVGSRARLLLQVHDELLLSVPEDEVAVTSTLVREVMEHAAELAVPLLVEVGVGRTWLEAH